VVSGPWLTPVGAFPSSTEKYWQKSVFAFFFGRIMVAYSLFFQLS